MGIKSVASKVQNTLIVAVTFLPCPVLSECADVIGDVFKCLCHDPSRWLEARVRAQLPELKHGTTTTSAHDPNAKDDAVDSDAADACLLVAVLFGDHTAAPAAKPNSSSSSSSHAATAA